MKWRRLRKSFFIEFSIDRCVVPDNATTNPADASGIPICRKKYQRPTSLSEVLIGLFMFLLGIGSLAFLAFYMYTRILSGATKSAR